MEAEKIRRRTYHSAFREQQAEITKQKILDASEALFLTRGYVETAIAAIAAKAGVAVQTIYAAFGSKPSLIIAIIERLRKNKGYTVRYAQARDTGCPTAVITALVGIFCEIYSTRSVLFERLLDAFATSPDLLEAVKQQHLKDRELLRVPIEHLRSGGALRPGLEPEEALDILWTLTSVPVYLHLVRARQWTSAHYAEWLEKILMFELCGLSPHTETD